MSKLGHRRAVTAVVGCAAAIALVLTGIAIAGNAPPVKFNGGALLQTKIATDYENLVISDLAKGWVDLDETELNASVPSGQNRVIVATFNAETFCSSAGKGWCSLRIVAQKPGGAVQQLYPRAGSDFAIDSGGGELWEGNIVIRSLKIGSGNWQVWVQGRVVGAGELHVDDWHFQVDVHN